MAATSDKAIIDNNKTSIILLGIYDNEDQTMTDVIPVLSHKN